MATPASTFAPVVGQSSQTFSGPRAIFSVDGNQVGFAAGVSGSESIDYEPVDVLDLLEVAEFVPVAYRTTLSAQMFRLVGQSLKAVGIFPHEQNILTTGELTCSLQDQITGNTVAQWQRVKTNEQSFDVASRGIVSTNVNFVAIRLLDESELPIGG